MTLYELKKYCLGNYSIHEYSTNFIGNLKKFNIRGGGFTKKKLSLQVKGTGAIEWFLFLHSEIFLSDFQPS